jgi:hypothetical protein
MIRALMLFATTIFLVINAKVTNPRPKFFYLSVFIPARLFGLTGY